MKGVHLEEVQRVIWSPKVEKQLARYPIRIGKKFDAWVAAVRIRGVREVRKIPGYHDEPLQGSLFGLRSVRLNQAYRLIYLERMGLIEILEVNKHVY